MKNLSALWSAIFLTILIGGAALWIRVFYTSIQTYSSPLDAAELQPQAPGPPKTSQLVIILINGLGYDTSLTLNLPVLEQLRRAGAQRAVQSIPPTYSQTAWATLVTGAPPETNGAPPFDVPIENLRVLETDTLFARAHQAGLQTALLGPADWRRLIPRNQLDYTLFVETSGAEADEIIAEAALSLVTDSNIDLILVQFNQLDFAAQYQGGAEGPAYRQAAYQIDAYLGQISASMDFSRTVLVVLSDHGHIPSGGHGGNEVEVVWQPLVMVGQHIIPGSYSDISQTDIAPTLAMLLGLAPPTATQGRVLYELVRLDEQERTAIELSLAQQRVALAQAYLEAVQKRGPITPTVEIVGADLARAKATYADNNMSGAYQLASLARTEADRYMTEARGERSSSERLPRLVAVLMVFFGWATIMWRRRGPHAMLVIVAVLLTLAVYHTLFQLQGYNYSVSSIRDLADWPLDVARRLGVSLVMGGMVTLIFLMFMNENNWRIILNTGYGYGILVTFVFALPLFWVFWQNGFAVGWRLPAITSTFWQITALFETMIAAGMALLLPWPLLGLATLVAWIRGRLSEAQAPSEPDTFPGLHL